MKINASDDPFYLITELQEQFEKLGIVVHSRSDVKSVLYENDIEEIKKRLYNLICDSFSHRSGFFSVHPIFYRRNILTNGSEYWETTISSNIDIKDYNNYRNCTNEIENNILTKMCPNKYVEIKQHDGTNVAVSFKNKYEQIPKLLNKYTLLKTIYDKKMEKRKGLNKGVKNIIAASIIGISIIVSAVIYAYSTRWEINNNGSARIDKWTGKIERVHQ